MINLSFFYTLLYQTQELKICVICDHMKESTSPALSGKHLVAFQSTSRCSDLPRRLIITVTL